MRTALLEILQHNPPAWQVSSTRAVLLMEPMTLRKLRKGILDYRLVFKKEELEAFLQVPLSNKLIWWRRILGE